MPGLPGPGLTADTENDGILQESVLFHGAVTHTGPARPGEEEEQQKRILLACTASSDIILHLVIH